MFGGPVTDTDPSTVTATTTAQVLEVIDGDTIVVSIANKKEFVRYIGIDTPEYSEDGQAECYAAEATAANKTMVADQTVSLMGDQANRDKYNRLLRYVYVGEQFVNAELVKNGFAKTLYIPPDTTYASEFKALEKAAKQQKIGLWKDCQKD